MSEGPTSPDRTGPGNGTESERSRGGDGEQAGGGPDGTGDGAIVEQISADAAFELLGNEGRLAVLRALFDADEAQSFSDLHDAVDIRDSGQFNYHLEKLVGVFVRKTDEGYRLTAEGKDVVGSILAGPYTKTVEADPVPVDATCASCGGPLVGRFDDDELVRVACDDCDRNVISLTIPPGAFEDYPREAWPVVAERWTRRQFETMQQGFCTVCHGPTTSHLETDPEALYDVFEVGVRYVCERCGEDMFANVEASLVFHPAVVAFHHERGVDIGTTPIWELDWAVRSSAEIVAEDPLRVEVSVECDGDVLVLTLDDRGDVVDERVE